MDMTGEAATHMAVAAAVGSDGADAGMGILSSAKAMDLDFIPIGPEEYDFAIPQAIWICPISRRSWRFCKRRFSSPP